jgi:hypothetical protein
VIFHCLFESGIPLRRNLRKFAADLTVVKNSKEVCHGALVLGGGKMRKGEVQVTRDEL